MKRLLAIALIIIAAPASAGDTPIGALIDWKDAPAAELARNTHARCTAQRLDDWVRVHCHSDYPSYTHARQVTGATDYTVLRRVHDGIEVVFRVEPGVAKTFSIGFGTSVSARWLTGESAPTIVIN